MSFAHANSNWISYLVCLFVADPQTKYIWVYGEGGGNMIVVFSMLSPDWLLIDWIFIYISYILQMVSFISFSHLSNWASHNNLIFTHSKSYKLSDTLRNIWTNRNIFCICTCSFYSLVLEITWYRIQEKKLTPEDGWFIGVY